MKINNSTQWFNLFSTELKYNIYLTPSHTKKRLIKGLTCLWVVAIFYGVYTWLANANFLALAICLMLLIIFKIIQTTDTKQLTSLTLSTEGTLKVENNDELHIHPNSRVGWLGCWLILTADNECKQRFFLFQDQCSKLDYSRLSRTILKITNSQF